MLNNIVVVLFMSVLGVFAMSSSLNPPTEFVLCHRSDREYQKCLLHAIQESIRAIASGNKELGVPILDQLKIPSINIKGNGGSVDLWQHYTDVVVIGATNSSFLHAETAFEKDNCYIRLKTITNVMTMTGKYVMTGRMLLFQLNGHGHTNLTTINWVAWHNMTCSIYEKNGNEYLGITDWVENYSADNVLYGFENLIDGNAELSAQVLQIMNENSLEVFEQLKEDYEKSFAAVYTQLTNNVFSKIPWKNLFPE